MNEIYSPQRVLKLLQNKGYPVLKSAFCTKNISWYELLVNQSDLPSLEVMLNLSLIAQTLQRYRNTIFKNSPIIITSAWRSKAYNKKIGGAPDSFHIKGMAIDFIVDGFSPKQIQSMLDVIHKGGLEFAPTWTHIDSRTQNIRFNNKGKILKL